MKQSWHFKIKNKINKTLAKESKIKCRPKLTKQEVKRMTLQQISQKSRQSLGKILNNCTPINWQIWKKQINFQTDMSYQNETNKKHLNKEIMSNNIESNFKKSSNKALLPFVSYGIV